MANTTYKTCKVYPAKGKRIPGVLPNNKVITEPGTYDLNFKEIRRCMNFGDVFEVTANGEVLLDERNYMLDNSNGKVVPVEDEHTSGESVDDKYVESSQDEKTISEPVEKADEQSDDTKEDDTQNVESLDEIADEKSAEKVDDEKHNNQQKQKYQSSKNTKNAASK